VNKEYEDFTSPATTCSGGVWSELARAYREAANRGSSLKEFW